MLQTVSSEGSGPTDRHNERVLKYWPPFSDGSDVPVRVLCNGKTSAFQADDTGSIPVTRFLSFLAISRHIALTLAAAESFIQPAVALANLVA